MPPEDQTSVTKTASRNETALPQSGSRLFWDLRDEINGLFEDFFPDAAIGRGRRRLGWGRQNSERATGLNFPSIPSIDVIDKQDEIKLTADLPGMTEADVEVEVTNGLLTLSGEKKEETEEGDQDGDYYLSERSFGSFKRTVRLPDGIDQDKIEAYFKNGVLTVRLPRKPEAQMAARRIEVKEKK